MTGWLAIAGLGPGAAQLVTPEVTAALAEATDLVGYGPYVARVSERAGLTRHGSDNREELDRAGLALPPGAEVIVARGPFDRAGDRAMLANFRAEIVVARNAGGGAASAKIEAARDLALPVVMVRRPFIPAREKAETVTEVLRWLGHGDTPAERGV